MSRLFEWIQHRNQTCHMTVEQIPFHASRDWQLDGTALRRRDSNFFSVVGIGVLNGTEHLPHLDQPLIRQPEIGILGFLLSTGPQGHEILVQSKSEPGNVPLCQLAPSVQATLSNYERRHGGQATAFLENFTAPAAGSVIADSLQSEQGTRFLGKYNRNMTVLVPADARPGETAFIRWFPLRSFLELLGQDFVVNTDARSVVVTTPWRHLAGAQGPFAHGRDSGEFGHLLWRSYRAQPHADARKVRAHRELLTRRRQHLQFRTKELALQDLSGWRVSADAIGHAGSPLAVQQHRIQTDEREVELWDQPMLASAQEGQAILLCQVRNGQLEFLFSCRAEPGFREQVQFGPTVQSPDGTDQWIFGELAQGEAHWADVCARSQPLLSCRQSDEGGRFYRCISRYSIRMLHSDEACDAGANCAWMTLAEIEALLPQQGIFTNEARTLLSMLLVHV